jgi:hypothetical protein
VNIRDDDESQMNHHHHECSCNVCAYSPNERWNNSVFSACLNASKDGSDWIDGGRLFHTLAAATGNARSPMVQWFALGTESDDDDKDRSRLRESLSATRCSSPARY